MSPRPLRGWILAALTLVFALAPGSTHGPECTASGARPQWASTGRQAQNSVYSCAASQRSASMAAMQPVPAAVTACR